MKNIYKFIFVVILIVLLFPTCARKRTPITFSNLYKTEYTGLLTVQGNKLMDLNGHIVILEGLNICYPLVIKQLGHWNEDYFKELASWSVRIVRVPIAPVHTDNLVKPAHSLYWMKQ